METKKIISLIGYGFVGLLVSATSIYYFIYNPEVYENRRFIESFKQPIEEAKNNPKQLKALQTLQGKGLEWAQYQLVESIKRADFETAKLYVEAGMALNKRGLVIGQMIESPETWIELSILLGVDSSEGLSGLFPVPRYLTSLDQYFAMVEKKYVAPHTMAFKNQRLEFNKIHDAWLLEKNLELKNVENICDGNTRCVAL